MVMCADPQIDLGGGSSDGNIFSQLLVKILRNLYHIRRGFTKERRKLVCVRGEDSSFGRTGTNMQAISTTDFAMEKVHYFSPLHQNVVGVV